MAKKIDDSSQAAGTKSEWIDISIPLYDNMVHRSNEPLAPHIELVRSREKGDHSALTQINISSHLGTHIDAPFYLIAGGKTIDQMPLDTVIGPARVIEIKDPETIKIKELEPYDIKPGERLLFKTRTSYNPERLTKVCTDYVYFETDTINYLADKKIRVLGIDYWSIGNFRKGQNIPAMHETLLNKDIYIIEDLNLTNVKPGRYEMICLPLRLRGGDASPSRAVIRPI